MGRYSELLYARPSFLAGMASAVDLGGTLIDYNGSPSPELADYYALRSDWRQVGDDMRVAIEEVAAEIPTTVPPSSVRPRRGRRR